MVAVTAVGQTESQSKAEEKKTVETKTESKQATTKGTAATAVPMLDGAIGPCSAEFHVVGGDNKPLYLVQVHTLIKYGAFGIKKLDLQISTNADGKAKFTGLPDVNKRPIFFDLKQGQKVAQRAFEPGTDCHPVFEVILQ